MNRTEIQEFKRFLHVRELFGMFSQYYRQNHLTSNPTTLEGYLEKAKAETVIPLAFVYPKTIYGKDFWLAIHEEWNWTPKRNISRSASRCWQRRKIICCLC